MGATAIVLGVFLMFSAGIAWIGGDREKAVLEDTVKDSKKAEAEMSQEASDAKEEAARKDEHLKELQDKLEASLNENKKLERALALEERKKRITAEENKSSHGIWDSGSGDDPSRDGEDGEGGAKDPRLQAAEESLRDEAAARAEAEKKLAVEARALESLERELNATLDTAGDSRLAGPVLSSAALCPWDPAGR